MSLSAAAADRKARLAQLKSLKRKAETPADEESTELADDSSALQAVSEPALPLSGRNYDPLLRAPKLGFESAPTSTTTTAEARAQSLAEAAEAAAAEAAAKPVDLLSIRPQKANADLARELQRRMEESGLEAATERAIAAIVRARIAAQSKNGEEGGVELVEATREREAELEEERRRDERADEALLAA